MSKKFENLILHICQQSASNSTFGRTKLNKLLYFVDFGHYREYGASISGQEYMAIQNGPVPRAMNPTLIRMISLGDLREEHIQVGARHPRCHIVALKEPDMSGFLSIEVAYVDGVLEKYSCMTGNELAVLSHAEPGYKAAYDEGSGRKIEYGTAYIPHYAIASQAVISRTKELAREHGWDMELA